MGVGVGVVEEGREEKEGGVKQSTQSLTRGPPPQKRTKHVPLPQWKIGEGERNLDLAAQKPLLPTKPDPCP